MTDPTPTLEDVRDLLHDELYEDALEALEGQDSPEACRLRAEALIGLEEFDDALAVLEPLVDGVPDDAQDAEALGLIGLCLYYVDELQESRDVLNRALRRDGANITALQARAIVHRDLEFQRASELDLDRALMVLEDDPDRRDLLGATWNIKAGFAIEDENHVGAEAALKKAIAADPEHSEYTLELARLYVVLNRTADALALLDGLLERDNLVIEAWLLKSQILYLTGRADDAHANTRAALEADDAEPYIYVQLGSFALYQQQWLEAIEHADKAIELDSNVVDSYQIKAAALRSLGRDAEIVGDLADLESSTPDLPGFIFGERINPAELAAEALEEAANMDPAQLRGMIEHLFASGQLPEAMRPMVEMTLENLPAILESMPAMTGMSPQELMSRMHTNPSLAGPLGLTLGEDGEIEQDD